MKIRRLDVDGFGSLARLSVDGISPNLTVITGQNEAGKSTLLDFVRFMLFGFPRGRSAARHEPLGGGRHGGSLRLIDAEGLEWILERHTDERSPVVTGPAGQSGGEDELRALLGGADANVFRTVFAFGLSELVSLENLESNEVRDLIFTAGVLGAGRSATKATRSLAERQSELLKPRARSARANDLAHRLEGARQRLRAQRALARTFPASAARLRGFAERTAAVARREDDLGKRRAELDELLAAWPSWHRLREAETRLAELGTPPESDSALMARAVEIRSLVEERSGHLGRLDKAETLARQLEGIENKIGVLTNEREERARRTDALAPHPRSTAEIREDQQRLRSIRSLVQQRDQATAIRIQRDAMLVAAKAAKRPPLSAGLVVSLVLSVVLAAVVAIVGVVRHQALIATLAIIAAVVAGAAILTELRSRSRGPTERVDVEREPPPVMADAARLTEEIARHAAAVGLAATPLLSEIESTSLELDKELERRERLERENDRIAEVDAELDELDGRRSTVIEAIAIEQSRIVEFDRRTREIADTCQIACDAPPATICLRLESALKDAAARGSERHALEERVASSRSSLAETIGSGDKADRVRALLAQGDRATWEAERERTGEAIEEARLTWRAARDEETAAIRELEELERSDEIARLEIEVAALTAELRKTLREWLKFGIARELLRETIESYERERQPAVIAKASELFALVTGGRYERLIAREDERAPGRTVVALSSSGSLVDAASLSRGTAEQLYLCLRLGLASVHAERSTALPFVLDDVLVNFDPQRAGAVAQVIAETAASHQVIFFTCHPHVVETFEKAAPGCRVVELAPPGEVPAA
jgi:uncharacterized protein YhaN